MPLIGIVKAPLASEEEEIQSEKGWPASTTGVVPFMRDYFNCKKTELYADETCAVYELLGNRTLKLPWFRIITRPWAARRWLKNISQRMKDKGVEAQSGGEGTLLGGICVIGPRDKGEPCFVYQEQIGSEIPVGEIEAAIRGAF